MKKGIFSFLSSLSSSETKFIDSLIVSSFIRYNNIIVRKNKLLSDYIIQKSNKDASIIFDRFYALVNSTFTEFTFENLIELFEFVVSPADKIVNGAIYTPEDIREFIVKNCTPDSAQEIAKLKIGDISCGCGGFLLSVAKRIKKLTSKSFKDIYQDNIFGIDIEEYSILRTKLLLTLYAINNGEDITEYQFNLFTGNSLNFNWNKNCAKINRNNGFDVIVGNPPYVCSRNMDTKTTSLLKRWEVSSTGHPDLYIPFFQIAIECLNRDKGILGYITVNTFINSINGRALREYFSVNDINLTILNFGGEQVFRDRNTYTCICILKIGQGCINYIRTQSKDINNVDLDSLHQFSYADLNNKDGWNLVNDKNTERFINQVESVGKPFRDIYNTKNGIATLKNEVYKFIPVDEDDNYYYLEDKDIIFPIEKEICRDIVNANKIKTTKDINRIKEKIIFPYNNQIEIINENDMRTRFLYTYKYLNAKKTILATRDKGLGDYEVWYAFGRRQSMDIHAYKLFFPHICEKPTFTICKEKDLLFYNGMAIVSDNLDSLLLVKKLLESCVFEKYIKNVTKDYASGYISMSRNYLKNFGVYQFDEQQKVDLLSLHNTDEFLSRLYDVYDFFNVDGETTV